MATKERDMRPLSERWVQGQYSGSTLTVGLGHIVAYVGWGSTRDHPDGPWVAHVGPYNFPTQFKTEEEARAKCEARIRAIAKYMNDAVTPQEDGDANQED